jgi:hypothetical protein
MKDMGESMELALFSGGSSAEPAANQLHKTSDSDPPLPKRWPPIFSAAARADILPALRSCIAAIDQAPRRVRTRLFARYCDELCFEELRSVERVVASLCEARAPGFDGISSLMHASLALADVAEGMRSLAECEPEIAGEQAKLLNVAGDLDRLRSDLTPDSCAWAWFAEYGDPA